MKRATLIPSILMAASVLITPAAKSAGMIVIDPIVGGVPTMHISVPIRPGHPTPHPIRPLLKGQVSFGLRLQGADVKVDITDQVAKTYIRQTFINDTDRNLAGTYLFPLPDDTTFSSFSLHIDGKPVEGKILEAQAARQQYEEIVRRMVDPGLLEYADYKTVRARIFPIPAHGTKQVELEYTQLLKSENGMLKYRFPLKTEGESAAAEEIKINVKLASKQGLRTIWSPSHIISANRSDDHLAKVSYLGKDTVADKDFLLYYSVSDKEMSANLMTHKDSGDDGFFLLTLSPPMQSKQTVGKDIVLVADTSGSMQGERMVQNKKALKYLVNALSASDRFSIVEFNTDVEQYNSNLVDATPENKRKALAFIDDLEARGGTNIGDALKIATTMLDQPSTRPGYLVLMTDGEPTVGETSVSGLLKAVHPKRDIRIFDFGVGYDVNTRLLNKLAEDHHGTSQYVEPNESLETALSAFYEKIRTPVLSNVKITYEGVQVKDIYPRQPKDIFAGTQLLLLGRYKGEGNTTVKIGGTVNGVAKAYSFPISFAASEAGHTYLPRLWAMRRIGHLTDVAQDNGNSKEVVDEIVALSKKYGIISQYTSFLVTEPTSTVAAAPRPFSRPMPSEDARGLDSFSSSSGGFGVAVHGRAGGGGTRVRGSLLANKRQFQIADGFFAPASAGSFDKEKTRGNGMWEAPRAEGALKDLIMNASPAVVSGKSAVMRSKKLDEFKQVAAVGSDRDSQMKTADDKVFVFKNGFWTDTTVASLSGAKQQVITFGSKEYFDLLKLPGISKYLSVGRQVIFIYKGQCYKIIYSENA